MPLLTVLGFAHNQTDVVPSENLHADDPNFSCTQMSHNGEPLIDLHGQHAAEGVATLRRELARLRSSSQQPQPASTTKGGQQTVYVLVGTGHHTKACFSHASPQQLTLVLTDG